MRSQIRRLNSVATTLALTSICLISSAIPLVGELAPNARVEDADGHAVDLRSATGKPVLIVYEDKDSGTLNKPFKDELSALAKGDRYRQSVALFAIADVSAYDFWPVKGFVKDAIRDESRKFQTTIYCDWTGAFRRSLDLARGTSNVVLLGKGGAILFSAAGRLDDAQRKRALALLKSEVEPG